MPEFNPWTASPDDARDHLALIRQHLDDYDDQVLFHLDPVERDLIWDNINFAMARICEVLGIDPEEIS